MTTERRDWTLWVVVGCWVLAVGSFALLPLVSTGPDAERVPGLDEIAWWVGAALVTAQAVVVLRWRSTPRSRRPLRATPGVAAWPSRAASMSTRAARP